VTIQELLNNANGAAPAIGAPGRAAMTFDGLHAQIDETIAALNGMGVGRGDRVAIVLPNGPEMASAFVAVGAGATTAPLNPAYRAEEFKFYLDDLGARLLIVETGSTSDAVGAARDLGIGIAELSAPEGAPAGTFTLTLIEPPREAGDPKTGPAAAGDIALVLHTSGTTSRPKIVPLSQTNVCASAAHIGQSLVLKPGDRSTFTV
jgi:acyl-CoA synthetase (AMP-forming)/AMP-acid ligase II